VAVVPASVHDESDRPGRNQLSGMFCNLQTHIEDPCERLLAIAEANSRAKEHSRALGPTLVLDWTQAAVRAVFGLVLGLAAHTPLSSTPVHNVIVSKVAGPQNKLYGLGAEIRALHPAWPDLSWFGTGHHGDVAERQAQRGHHFVPAIGRRSVGPGRPLRDRTRQPAWQPNATSGLSSPSAGGFDSEGHRFRLARVVRIGTFGSACDDVSVVGEGNVRTAGTFAGDAAEAVEIVDIDCLGDGLLTPDLEEAAGSSRPRLCLDDHRPLQLRA
jgi:hypothetical protein